MKNEEDKIYISIIVILLVVSAFFTYTNFQKSTKIIDLNKEVKELKENTENLSTENRNLRVEVEKLKEDIEMNNTPINNIKKISYAELNDLLNNGSKFILVVTKTDCTHCKAYLPKLNKVLYKHSQTAYEIDYLSLTDEEKVIFKSIFNMTNTPTTTFVENGVESSVSYRLVGNVTEEKIIERLKEMNYIQ